MASRATTAGFGHFHDRLDAARCAAIDSGENVRLADTQAVADNAAGCGASGGHCVLVRRFVGFSASDSRAAVVETESQSHPIVIGFTADVNQNWIQNKRISGNSLVQPSAEIWGFDTVFHPIYW